MFFQMEQIRADIRDFKKSSGVDKVIVLWTANTERFCEIIPGVNDTTKNLLAAIQVSSICRYSSRVIITKQLMLRHRGGGCIHTSSFFTREEQQRFLHPLCLQSPAYWRAAPTSMVPHRTLSLQEPSSWLSREACSLAGTTSSPARPRSSQCLWTFWSAQASRWETGCMDSSDIHLSVERVKHNTKPTMSFYFPNNKVSIFLFAFDSQPPSSVTTTSATTTGKTCRPRSSSALKRSPRATWWMTWCGPTPSSTSLGRNLTTV